MLSPNLIGAISLNLSFGLYLILYVPQLIHNRKSTNIAQLSLNLHLLLYISYFFDLCYGFSKHLPWQYKTVSVIGLLLIGVQHLQLIKYFIHSGHYFLTQLSILFLIINLGAIYYFFSMAHATLPQQTTLIVGIIARFAGLMYCLPQIIKNKIIQSANGLSVHFLRLNFTLALLDTISSWCLNWGWPNKIAAPISTIFMMIMLSQIKKYKPELSSVFTKEEMGCVNNSAQSQR